MKKIRLNNGLKVIMKERQTESIIIGINVNCGSNDEPKKLLGISHFIEHMVFEGTKKRKDTTDISNEIERLGGELNAATTNERTFFYAKVLDKHFDIALDVLHDLVFNPVFNKKKIEKERKIILNEIKMVVDEPRSYQWVLLQQILFKKHPAKNPIYGTEATVKKIKRNDIIDFYKKHYVPENISVCVVGNIKNNFDKIKRYFGNIKSEKIAGRKQVIEPEQDKNFTKKEKRNLMQSYAIMAFKTIGRNHHDSYVLDVIHAHLGRGQSGRLFEIIRTRHGLAYEIGVYHRPGKDYGFFSVYFGAKKENIEKIKALVLKELKNSITEKELKEAKNYIEGDFVLENEDTIKLADSLCEMEFISKAEDFNEFVKKIRKVSKKDIGDVLRKYFKNYTMVVIS